MKTITENISRGLLIVLSLLFFSSCSEDDLNAEEIYFESIARHYLTTGEGFAELQLVIRDRESWEELLAQLNSVNDQTKYFSRTEFNFSEEILLVVIDKFRPNGGHSIAVSTLLEKDGEIIALITKPQQGNPTTMVMQPYHIITIEKTNKNIGFIKEYK
ncbi:protease complex subunit PrcB family protein [Salegentibacter flavus]|uniref:PrcB C-terminal n=1 Tax=Salegentibacter flavus TaxID=287099 RepID=A0A1I5CE58_9FLAO|nr:protease complex subunit PrcB family protein [Salegentibacter flavus]SFN85300.1 hypothetical protein SAMN05660413_02812 [Salegentibacter flavus]